jgi:hypothetical protein
MDSSSTTDIAIVHETITPPLSFMDLPVEIRIRIYELLFDGVNTVADAEISHQRKSFAHQDTHPWRCGLVHGANLLWSSSRLRWGQV